MSRAAATPTHRSMGWKLGSADRNAAAKPSMRCSAFPEKSVPGASLHACPSLVAKRAIKTYGILGSSHILPQSKKHHSSNPIAKKIAKLMLDGKEYSEIYEECYTNNYIEIEFPDRRREITNVIYGRLSALDPYLLSEFYDGDVATSKFILAYSIAKTDTLFFDFMAEIYREALLGDKHYLSIDDFDNFFAVKKQSDLIVAKWGDFTLHCLTKGYRNILVDSGLGIRERRTIKVERMMIHPNVEEYIASIGDKEYLQAMLGR